MTLPEIATRLQNEPDIPPQELGIMHSWCAGEFSFLAGRMEVVLAQKPAEWLRLRNDSQSTAEAENRWRITAFGIEEMQLRLRMKALEKILSSLKSRIDIKKAESMHVM